jgi:hypothetical protein
LYAFGPFTWRKGKATRSTEIPESAKPVEFDGGNNYPEQGSDEDYDVQPNGNIRVPRTMTTVEAALPASGIDEAIRRLTKAQEQSNQWKTERAT